MYQGLGLWRDRRISWPQRIGVCEGLGITCIAIKHTGKGKSSDSSACFCCQEVLRPHV